MSPGTRRSALIALIPFFVLWHMAAAALYLLPADGRFAAARSVTSPYILLFSQWQKWDIFSPDPLRRVSLYGIERETKDGWELALKIDYDSLPWWRRAKELKVASRIEDGWNRLTEHYLLSLCDDIDNVRGTKIRMIKSVTALPKYLHELKSVATARAEPTETVMASVTCPQ